MAHSAAARTAPWPAQVHSNRNYASFLVDERASLFVESALPAVQLAGDRRVAIVLASPLAGSSRPLGP